MLQARKKIQRKELKKDPFFEKIDQGVRFYNRNKNNIYSVIAVILLVIAAYYFINARGEAKSERSAAAFGIAQQYLDAGDYDSAESKLNELLNGDSDREFTGLATYYLAYIAMTRQDYDRALEGFEDYLNNFHNRNLYNEAALEGIASIEEGRGNLQKAAEHYRKASGYSENSARDFELLSSAVHCYLKAGMADDAQKIVAELRKDSALMSEFEAQVDLLQTMLD